MGFMQKTGAGHSVGSWAPGYSDSLCCNGLFNLTPSRDCDELSFMHCRNTSGGGSYWIVSSLSTTRLTM